MGPSLEDPLCTDVVQGASWRLGRRICLLKDCHRIYRPNHPLSRYCSQSCRQAAARWHQRDANQRYRASDRGKSCRRAQSSRYRRRKADARTAENDTQSPLAGGDDVFNSSDLLRVFQAGEYEDGIEENSTWDEGD